VRFNTGTKIRERGEATRHEIFERAKFSFVLSTGTTAEGGEIGRPNGELPGGKIGKKMCGVENA